MQALYDSGWKRPDPSTWREPEFPCWVVVEKLGRRYWTFFDHQAQIAKLPSAYLNSLEKKVGYGISKTTVDQYSSDLKRALDVLLAVFPVKAITVDQCLRLAQRDHIASMNGAAQMCGISASTIVRREVVLRGLLEWLTSNAAGKIRDDHPYEIDSRMLASGQAAAQSSKKMAADLVTQDMVISLLNTFHNECERILFHFIYDTGSRISEALDVTLGEIPNLLDYPDAEYIPMRIRGVKGKAGRRKMRWVPVSRSVIIRLARYHNSYDYRLRPAKESGYKVTDPEKPAFLTSNLHRWTYSNAKNQYDAAVKRGGLPHWFGPHGLRHGCVYSILSCEDMGAAYHDRLEEARKRLGHNWLSTTEMIYGNLPVTVLTVLAKQAKGQSFYKRADIIAKATYLADNEHNEKRGHRA